MHIFLTKHSAEFLHFIRFGTKGYQLEEHKLNNTIRMNSVASLGVVVAVVLVVAEAWPSLYDNEFKRWSLSRRSYCKESGGKCYSTSDCCKSYVCAAFDEYGGPSRSMEPTMPGWCVHEKELQPCVSNLDCEEGKCMSLGQHRYCVHRPQGYGGSDDDQGIEGINQGNSKKGGLGTSCEDNSGCHDYSSDGKSKLCCQSVRRGRYGKKKMCDRVTGISVCLSKRK